MTIQDAVKEAMQTDKCISRKNDFWETASLKIKPTNMDVCCICIKNPSATRGWEPQAEDLIANDWIVVD